MPALDPLIQHAAPFLLVLFRIAGMFVFTPLIGGASVPMVARALFAFSLAVAVYPSVPAETTALPDLDLVSYVPLMFTEVLIGAVIGLIASLPLIATQMAGHLMGYQMALGLAQAYNPDLDVEGSAISQILYYLALASFLTLGGLDGVFAALLATFDTVRVGAFGVDLVPLDLFTGLLAGSFELAIRLSAPVVGIVMLMLVAMGFMMKTMPQINILSVGFAAKIMGGLTMLLFILVVVDRVLADEIARVSGLLMEWASSLGEAPGG